MFDCMFVFFFKQKTAYEVRISDWSSDVCSSDLKVRGMALLLTLGAVVFVVAAVVVLTVVPAAVEGSVLGNAAKTALNIARWPVLAVSFAAEIGRASCRERVCQYG